MTDSCGRSQIQHPTCHADQRLRGRGLALGRWDLPIDEGCKHRRWDLPVGEEAKCAKKIAATGNQTMNLSVARAGT